MSETAETAATERACTRCGRVKPLTEFYALRRGRHGRRPDCKRCHNAYHNDWARERYVPKTGRRYKRRQKPGASEGESTRALPPAAERAVINNEAV